MRSVPFDCFDGPFLIFFFQATASVDYATDVVVQKAIKREFAGKTMLCIARLSSVFLMLFHLSQTLTDRLRTILGYDRILIIGAGQVEGFDTPLSLYDELDSPFRKMCEASDISREDVLQAAVDTKTSRRARDL